MRLSAQPGTLTGMPSAAPQAPFRTSEQRYRAVSARDASADGCFLYAVVTTGIYCRPNCGARLAHRHNMRFFESAEQAAQAGFRPCKRCRPDAVSLQQRQTDWVERARQLIDESDAAPRLEELAVRLGISKFHLHRLFKRELGVTPHEYAASGKLARARAGLHERAGVTRALYEAGYASSSRFYAESTALGMQPSQLRRHGKGQTLRSAIERCSLGVVLVGASERGVCWVALGGARTKLERDFRVRFSKAELLGPDARVRGYARDVVELIEGSNIQRDLPLDLLGTLFQRRVWQALRRTPRGRTTTYAEVAHQLGNPRAARAVGRACAENPVAVLVPCHRVLPRSGGLGDFRWGVARKRALLEREGRAGRSAHSTRSRT